MIAGRPEKPPTSNAVLLSGCFALVFVATLGPLVFKTVQLAKVPVNTTTLTWLTEFGKLVASIFLLFATERSLPSLSLIYTKKFYLYMAPALIYAVGNIAWAEVLLRLPISSAVVFAQLKLLLTAITSVTFLGRRYKLTQWLALVILTAGAMGTQYSPLFSLESAPVAAYVYVFINCLSSALGGVVTEALFKGQDGGQSLHLQNVQLYFWGSVVLMIGQLGSGGTMLAGVNGGMLLISGSNILLGLAVAWVIKFVDAVAKVATFYSHLQTICAALTLVTVPLCGVFLLSEPLTFPLVTSGISVVCASILFSLLSY